MKPGKHFNLSKTTKRVMATLLGDQKHAYKSAMIQAELAAAIRNGDLDDRFNEVVELVRASVLDKLAVANPSYALPTSTSTSND